MRPDMMEGADRLGAILKASDPLLTEDRLSRSDAALMRQALLEEAEQAEGPGWIPLAAGAALAALSLAALLLVRLPDLSTPGLGRDSSSSTGGIVLSKRAVRTIHFTTAGGTRVVWSLDPDFELRTERQPGSDRS